MTKTRSGRMGAMELAESLASQHGCGKRFAPGECWAVANNAVVKINVTMVRGSCDAYDRRFDYAESSDGNVYSSRYLFPVKTHKRPSLVEMADGFGVFHDWVSDPKRRPR